MICRCGHEESKHHRAKSCTAIVDEVKLKYCKCEQFREVQVEQGENEMAKKKKLAVKRQRGAFLYEAFSSKIESSKLGKKAADKETTSHTPLVAQVLVKLDKPVGFERIVEAVKDTKRYKSSNVLRCVRGDLGILVREGLVKATKIENASKANGSAKPKRVRKPRAKRPSAGEVLANELKQEAGAAA